MFSVKFWKATAERVISSFAGGVIAFWATGEGMNLFEVSFQDSLGVGLGAAAVSLLKALAAPSLTKTPGPSLIKSEQTIKDEVNFD